MDSLLLRFALVAVTVLVLLAAVSWDAQEYACFGAVADPGFAQRMTPAERERCEAMRPAR